MKQSVKVTFRVTRSGSSRTSSGLGFGTRVGGSSCLTGFSPGMTGSSGPGFGVGFGFMLLVLQVLCHESGKAPGTSNNPKWRLKR